MQLKGHGEGRWNWEGGGVSSVDKREVMLVNVKIMNIGVLRWRNRDQPNKFLRITSIAR